MQSNRAKTGWNVQFNGRRNMGRLREAELRSPSGGAEVDGTSRTRSTRPWFERFSDLVITCGLIVLLLPLMIVVAIAIKCDSRGPVLVWELRRRPLERDFWALKFRSTEL